MTGESSPAQTAEVNQQPIGVPSTKTQPPQTPPPVVAGNQSLSPPPMSPSGSPKTHRVKLILTLLFLIPLVTLVVVISLYFIRGNLRIEIPKLGRVDFSRTLQKEDYQVHLNYYGPIEKNQRLYLIGKPLKKPASDTLAIIYNEYGEKLELRLTNQTTLYQQLTPTRVDIFLGATRYKILKGIDWDVISNDDWLIVEYTKQNDLISITQNSF